MNSKQQDRIDACVRALNGIKDPEAFMKDVLALIRGISQPVSEMVPVIRRLEEAIADIES